MTSSGPDQVDIAVAGAGIVGLAVALGVKRDAPAGSVVAVCDATLAETGQTSRSLRAVAIAAGSRRLLERLGVWTAVASAAQPINDMVLTDTRPGAMPPPIYLSFAGDVAPGEPFAHMIVQEQLSDALLEACRRAGVLLLGRRIGDLAVRPHAIVLDPGRAPVAARLLVAADGGRSLLRERAGIRTTGWDYGQTAIVATLAHDRDHEGRATQHFLPGGPLAMLPLLANDGTRRRVSIVWTERQVEAERLLALPASAFVAALRERVGHAYGDLRLEDRPSGRPLRLRLARSLVAPRLALVGDAARLVHPLAGQGLNLGLRDAGALGEAVVAAMALGLDPGSPQVLARYQQARRSDSVALAATTDMLNRLFSSDSAPLRLIRDVGLGLVDRAPGLKRFLMRQAAGLAEPRPRLEPRRRPDAG